MGKLGLSVGAALVLASVGCGDDGSHPPTLKSGLGGSGAVVGTGGSGTGGSGGDCQPDPTTGSVIQGNLVVFDPTLLTPVSFMGKAILVMEGTPCGYAVGGYDATVDPVENFVLQGVKKLDFNWMHAYQDDATSEDVMTTLRVVYTQQDQSILDQFGFVRASDVEEMYTSAGVGRDPAKGTVLVQVVEGKLKTGHPGAIVSTLANAQVAYPSGGGWAIGGQTDLAGVGALLNADASEFPGSSVGVHIETSAGGQDFTALVEADAVSIITFAVGF